MKDTKKQYSAPEAEVIRFDSEDIITANTGGTSGHATTLPIISTSAY